MYDLWFIIPHSHFCFILFQRGDLNLFFFKKCLIFFPYLSFSPHYHYVGVTNIVLGYLHRSLFDQSRNVRYYLWKSWFLSKIPLAKTLTVVKSISLWIHNKTELYLVWSLVADTASNSKKMPICLEVIIPQTAQMHCWRGLHSKRITSAPMFSAIKCI